MNRILSSLQRVTSSTKFIPEIDGLRFLAIISVILYHVNGFIVEKNHHEYTNAVSKNIISNILSRGHLGVELFFVISGFILSYPFASHYINNTPLPAIRQYLIRRLTRLEPPYILSMILLFFTIIIIGKYSFDVLFPSLLASLTYTHNFFYIGSLPLINAVAWSLEIEIQFYLIAPFLARIFSIDRFKRRIIMVCFIILSIGLQDLIRYYVPVPTLLNYIQYFVIGFLLSDLKLTESKFQFTFNNMFCVLLGVIAFISIWLFDTKDRNSPYLINSVYQLLVIASIFVFYYLVLFNEFWKRIFSIQILTVIGGMCYSIYLLHYPIISMIGNPLINRVSISNHYLIDFCFYLVILTFFVVVISSIYFKLIEQPCMKRDWHLNLVNNMKSYITSK